MTEDPVLTVLTRADSGSLTTAARVNQLLGRDESVQEDLLETLIEAVSEDCARWCNLAGDAPTFGLEALQADWPEGCYRSSTILLPWRVPIVSIDEVTEAGTVLASTAYRLAGGGRLVRVSNCWASGALRVKYTAGWVLPDGAPAGLAGQVTEQVKFRLMAAKRDPALRSETVPDVWAGTWNTPGGDMIAGNGFLPPLQAALSSYRNWAVV